MEWCRRTEANVEHTGERANFVRDLIVTLVRADIRREQGSIKAGVVGHPAGLIADLGKAIFEVHGHEALIFHYQDRRPVLSAASTRLQ